MPILLDKFDKKIKLDSIIRDFWNLLNTVKDYKIIKS